jgi:hypothetical protein
MAGERGIPSRCACLKERRDDVIALVFIGTQKPVFEDEHLPVSPAIGQSRSGVGGTCLVRRYPNRQFGIFRWDEFQPVACSVAVKCAMAGQVLRVGVKPKFLLKPRGDGDQWCHPMRLLRVRLAQSAMSAPRPLSVQERRFQITWRSSLHRQMQTVRYAVSAPCNSGEYPRSTALLRLPLRGQ